MRISGWLSAQAEEVISWANSKRKYYKYEFPVIDLLSEYLILEGKAPNVF